MNPAPEPRAEMRNRAPSSRFSPRWKLAARRAWCGALLFWLLLPLLFFPPQPDSSIYWLAGRAIARGEVPYRAVFDIKTPGIHWLFALPASFGASAIDSWKWVCLLDLVLLSLSAFLVGRLAKQIVGETLAPFATLWFLVLHLSGQMAGFSQTETWALPFFLGAWWLLPNSTQNEENRFANRARFCFSGLLSGLTFVIKPTSAIPILGLLFLSFWRAKSTKNEGASHFSPKNQATIIEIMRLSALWIFGFGLPVFATFWWLKASGAWPDFVDIWLHFTTPYIESARDPAPAHLLVWIVLSSFYIVRFPLPAALTLLGFLSRSAWKPGAKKWVFAFLSGAIIALWIQNRLFEYHLKILLPVVAMIITMGASEVARLARFSPRRTAIFLFALPAIYAIWTRGSAIVAAPFYATHRFPRAAWFGILEKKHPSAERDESVARSGEWMRNRARSGDTLMVWGFAPQLYLTSDLKPASRFVYLPPIAARYAPARWKSEFLREFQSHPPRFFVILDEDLTWHGVKAKTPARALQQWTALNDFFAPRYHRAAQWPDLEVWERK